jgi:hypothetical protein
MRVTTGLSSEYSLGDGGDGIGRGARAKLRLEKLETLGDLAQAVLWKHWRDVPGRAARGPMIKGRCAHGPAAAIQRMHAAPVHAPVVIPDRRAREDVDARRVPLGWSRIDTASGKPKTRERAT